MEKSRIKTHKEEGGGLAGPWPKKDKDIFSYNQYHLWFSMHILSKKVQLIMNMIDF